MALTNAQYDSLMRTYQTRQRERELLIEERKNRLFSEVPEIEDIDHEIASVSIAAAKALLSDAPDTPAPSLSALREKKRRLMKSHGFPENYLDPPFTCPDCRDTGYIGNSRCHCFIQASIDLLYRQANLTNILRSENFHSFSLSFYDTLLRDEDVGMNARENAEKILHYCKGFCDSFGKNSESLLLYGNTGAGKTFLTHCIARELLEHNHSVVYFTAFEFFEALAAKAFHRGEASRDTGYTTEAGLSAADAIYSAELLIIDDLGTELPNTFTDSQLFECINERLLLNKPLLISTNLSTAQISDRYSRRTYSRIIGSFRIFKLFSRDIRLQKKLGM